jgi:hypothetical protein
MVCPSLNGIIGAKLCGLLQRDVYRLLGATLYGLLQGNISGLLDAKCMACCRETIVYALRV